MKPLLLIFIFFNALSLPGQPPDIKKYFDLAEASFKERDNESAYEYMHEAYKLHPYHQGVLYMKAKGAALTNRPDEALECLKKAIEINAGYSLAVPEFNKIKDLDGFKKLVDEQKKMNDPIIHSVNALVIKDRQLHTEGIAYDVEHQLFYLGSIHKRKIVVVKANGETADFCPSGFEGMTSVFGLTIDAKRKILWACTSPIAEMEKSDSTLRSAVYMFDLTTGKLLKKFKVSADEPDGTFGDLVIAPSGTVYISDSGKNRIFTVDEKQNDLVPFLSSKVFWNIQGLTFSDKGEDLFVADYIKGIFKVSIKSRFPIPVPAPENFSLKGIDGIYYYHNSLVAIQNGVSPNRATRYYLSDNGNDIIKTEIIDRRHPAFGEPTLGVITGNSFYYIANSQWDGYVNHKIKPAEKLKDIVVLKYTLQ